jgi:large subunit ribosomal protein L29
VKANEMREITSEQLQELLRKRQADLMTFRMDQVTGVVENVRATRVARRDIARINTILRERELAAAPRTQPAKKGT